jgi:long-chain fatty acid transport protein
VAYPALFKMKKFFALAASLAGIIPVWAGGFQHPAQSTKALGLGGAFTALARDPSAVYFNPGALARVDTFAVSVGAAWFQTHTVFRSQSTFVQENTNSPAMLPAYLYVTVPISEKLTAGLGVYSPYGYNTQWPDSWEGRTVIRQSRLWTYYAQPTLSYRLGEKFSLGAGLVIATGGIESRRQLGNYDLDFEAKGTGNGLGFNAGVLGQLDEDISFGVSFRSGVKLKVKNGELGYQNVPAAISGLYPASADFTSEVDLPSTLSVGFNDRINKRLALAFEFNLTSWSTYDSLKLEMAGTAPENTTRARSYEDAMSFRIGAQFLASEKLTLRAGFLYEESPVKSDNLTPEFPDANKLGGSVGLSWHIMPHLELDAAYLYTIGTTRSINASTSDITNPALSGTYRTSGNTAGLGLTYYF